MARSDMRISTKLALLVGVFAVAFTTFAWVTFETLGRVKVSGPVYSRIVEGKDIVADVLPPPVYIIESYLTCLQLQVETDKVMVSKLVDRGKRLRAEYDMRHEFWLKTLEDGPIKQAIIMRSYRPAIEFFDIRDKELVPAVMAGDHAKVSALLTGALKDRYEDHRAAVDDIVVWTNQRNADDEKAALVTLDKAYTLMKGLTGGIALLLIAFAYMTWDLSKSLTERLGIVASAATRVAEGDLTVKLDAAGTDELGQMINAVRKMTDGQSSLVSRVKQSSIELLSTATQIAAASKEQDATMSSFGASTTEVASAVREISTTSQELLRTMGEVAAMAGGASTRAEEGRASLSELENTMRGLNEATGSISAKLNTIHERAADINGVVTTITKVADQTNLLSVNAAIEAEKAGEYGRGFLVLAREIRRLADQTAVSTLDIERIVRTMQAAVTAGVMEMDKFADEMRRSRERVSLVGTQVSEVIEQVQGVLARFEIVGAGMKNQSDGARQISSSMTQLNESARQISSSLREFNDATGHMRDAVDGLKQEIAHYRVEA